MAKLSQLRKYLVLETFRSKVSPLSEKGVWGIGNVDEVSAEERSFASRTNLRNINKSELAKLEKIW